MDLGGTFSIVQERTRAWGAIDGVWLQGACAWPLASEGLSKVVNQVVSVALTRGMLPPRLTRAFHVQAPRFEAPLTLKAPTIIRCPDVERRSVRMRLPQQ
jgi:hypothetical protein